MRLTPELLEAAYEFLRATPPFRRWALPPGEYQTFRVGRTRYQVGSYRWDPERERHVVMISGGLVQHVSTLMRAVAHEMVHLHQNCRQTETPNTEHNAEFWRLAKIVCRHHGFDPLEF